MIIDAQKFTHVDYALMTFSSNIVTQKRFAIKNDIIFEFILGLLIGIILGYYLYYKIHKDQLLILIMNQKIDKIINLIEPTKRHNNKPSKQVGERSYLADVEKLWKN